MPDEIDPTKHTVAALIPARAGSKRIAGKNTRDLNGHPLIAYTIRAAIDSGVFDAVMVSTESERIAEIARRYGAEVPFLRPPEFAADTSPDIEWLAHHLGALRDAGREYDCFSILRPTSPFRKPETIRRAWRDFLQADGHDSLRAVELARQHPGKMWVLTGGRMSPLLLNPANQTPWHSTPYQALPPVYIQNASLEIAWTRVVLEGGTIAGDDIVPFVTEGLEGFDLNDPEDWVVAEHMISQDPSTLPSVSPA